MTPKISKKTPKHLYIESIGKRKTSIARVRLSEGKRNEIVVNGKPLESYFPTRFLQVTAEEPFLKAKPEKTFFVTVKVTGGGIRSQSEALRHGLSRALAGADKDWRQRLKKLGFLTRDSRIKERRKFGKKKARKSPQWSKR